MGDSERERKRERESGKYIEIGSERENAVRRAG